MPRIKGLGGTRGLRKFKIYRCRSREAVAQAGFSGLRPFVSTSKVQKEEDIKFDNRL